MGCLVCGVYSVVNQDNSKLFIHNKKGKIVTAHPFDRLYRKEKRGLQNEGVYDARSSTQHMTM